MKSFLLIHLHIPKCAGTTLNNILGNNFQGECYAFGNQKHDIEFNEKSPSERSKDYRVAFGHLKYGIHEKFQTDDFVYFSVLRDPIERICSLFNYIHLKSEHPLNAGFKTSLIDLNDITEDFIETEPGVKGNFRNYMSSALLGRRCSTYLDFENLKLHIEKLMSEDRMKIGSFEYVKNELNQFIDNKAVDSNVKLNVTKDLLKEKSGLDFEVANVKTLSNSTYELLSKINIFDIRIFEKYINIDH